MIGYSAEIEVFLNRLYRPLLVFVLAAAVLVSCGEKAKSSRAAGDELFAKAYEAQANGDYLASVRAYDEIIAKHQGHPNIDKAYFMRGYIRFENLNDKAGAIQDMNHLIDKFPTSDLVDDARFIIESINSGEDIITRFKQKSGDQ